MLITVLAVVILFFAITTKAAEYYPNYLDPQNVIYKPVIESNQRLGNRNLSFHPIRASKTISEEALRQYLEAKHSPLVSEVRQILDSPFWSSIISICTIEEYSCSVNPHGTNNLWGLMSSGHLISYPSLSDGILAIENFLATADSRGRTTIESFRGWYCASACTNWESTVIHTKEIIENLPN